MKLTRKETRIADAAGLVARPLLRAVWAVFKLGTYVNKNAWKYAGLAEFFIECTHCRSGKQIDKVARNYMDVLDEFPNL